MIKKLNIPLIPFLSLSGLPILFPSPFTLKAGNIRVTAPELRFSMGGGNFLPSFEPSVRVSPTP